jgi:succinyl-diaminopimelate desuccinylase
MTDQLKTIDSYIEQNGQRFEQDLFEWLRMPSVSTDSKYKQDVRKAGSWLADRLKALGLQSQLLETNGHPIVWAESPPVPGAPTVLIYGHYDVQPVDPLAEWTTPPFEPTVRDGRLYARGSTDDKGQLITHLFSTEAWIKTQGKLPVQLKFLIEGEEECGSEALYEFFDGKYDNGGPPVGERLKSDICVISDTTMYGPDQPAITYGLKGIAYFELRLTGPKQDLHSGAFGGSVTNPANALCQILAALKNADGCIQLEGFYKDVRQLSQREREEFAALEFSDKEYMESLGIDAVTGEAGYTTLERRWARPTFDINGIWGGYQGEGAKTVLPAKAGAKFSFRLVPNQRPETVKKSLEKFVRAHCPPGVRYELVDLHAAPGVVVPLDSPYMESAARAIESAFGKRPVFIRTGGSIPVVTTLAEKWHIDTLLLGWGQDDDNAHSPNEKFSLADFHKGIHASAHLWNELGKVGSK